MCVPWTEHFLELEKELSLDVHEITYIVYQDPTSGQWRVQSIPIDKKSAFKNRLLFMKFFASKIRSSLFIYFQHFILYMKYKMCRDIRNFLSNCFIWAISQRNLKLFYCTTKNNFLLSWNSICRLPLAESWRGLRDAELSSVAGINGCVFVHMSGFIGGNETRTGALDMARKSLALAGKYKH